LQYVRQGFSYSQVPVFAALFVILRRSCVGRAWDKTGVPLA
jgi:hypothetical protein